MGRLTHDSGTGFGQGLKARRDIDRVAEDGDRGTRTALYLANHRRSGIDADPQLRLDAMFCFEIAARRFQLLKDRKGRLARPKRRVLECNWGPKHRHDPIAGKALHAPALVVHGVFHQL